MQECKNCRFFRDDFLGLPYCGRRKVVYSKVYGKMETGDPQADGDIEDVRENRCKGTWFEPNLRTRIKNLLQSFFLKI